MVYIKHDAELMTSLLAAEKIPVGNHFVAFKDTSSNVALFSLSEHGKLNLVMDDNGEPTMMNFRNILPYEGSVLAFDLQQHSDLTLNIGLVTQGSNGKRTFHLVQRASPDHLWEGGNLEAYTIGGATEVPVTRRIFMSDFTRTVAGKEFPLVFLAFEREDRITKEEQLGFVDITVTDGKPVLQFNTWKLATNPQKILAIAFGKCPVGEGVFVLYQTGDSKKLQFLTLDGTDFTVEPTCPTGMIYRLGATCLTSFLHPSTGYSVLLVGGNGVTELTYKQYTKSTGTGTTVVSADKAQGLKGIHAALVDENLTIWYTVADNSAHYYATHMDSMTDGKHIPLLKEGEGGRLSGILAVRSALDKDDSSSILVQTLILVNTAGDLFLLQEASDTKIWEVHPFYVGSRTDNIEMDGYALRIQAVPEAKTNPEKDTDVTTELEVVAGCQLHVISSGYTRALVNGRATNLTSNGAWFRTDSQGVLLIIMGTNDVACHSIHIDGYLPPNATGEEVKYQPIHSSLMDASTKVVKKLRQIRSGKDLMTAKTQSGQELVEPGSLSESDADTIARNIARLCAHLDTHIDYRSKLLKAGTLKHFFFSDLVDSAWAAFHWVQEKAQEATDWVIDTAKSLWTLTVKLAGEVYNFVLSTAETVLRAIGWLLAKSGVVVKKLIDFAGFIFNWSDIVHTSDSISTLISVGLSYGQEKLESVNDAIQSWINDTKELVQSYRRGGLESQRKELSRVERVERKDIIPQADQLIKVPPWAGASNPLLSDIWDAICKEFEVIKRLAEQLGSQIPHVFGSDDERNEASFNIDNDVCDAAFKSIENSATVIFKAAELLIATVRALGETPIDIPVFTALWHTIAGKDRPFTLFNCFSLLMAIPTTIVYKLLYHRTPPRLEGRVTKETLAGYFNGTKPTDLSLDNDLRTFTGAGAIGAGYVCVAFTTLSLAQSLASRSTGMRFQLARQQRRYQTWTTASGPGAWTPRAHMIWTEIGATVTQFVGVLSSVPPWEGFDNETALSLAWVVWGGDLAWLIASTTVRVYCISSTTGTHVEDFMKYAALG
ncbi:hypothetical protein F5884DRAFT_887922 [Xylogone sp. PMI_703]|nr:hypothetical protein F5884DRAFT_887922 [Xylogone sp. PMI_703]